MGKTIPMIGAFDTKGQRIRIPAGVDPCPRAQSANHEHRRSRINRFLLFLYE